ncbi:YceI family protein [Occultella gossypii]|uniref:YceI family protein n=1 Tax=Occultella gossypii TaxID=2800820 RepID=A0ABS7SE73_9MICO|nr:YceI family protein [Occultella gossypii]MBZ2198054.1 YceI family protein [Occultella gossypii]
MSNVIPAGTYVIDASHSEVGFQVRHSGIAKVKGRFTEFSGSFTVAENFADSSATVTIAAGSVHTGNEGRDGHLTSADFWDAATKPEWTFVSTSVEGSGEEFALIGDLTVNGVTKPVTLDVEFNGALADATGADKVGFSASTEISRKEFGLTWNVALEGGGLLVGDKVKLSIEVEAVKELASVNA